MTGVGRHHDDLVLWTKLHRSHLDLLPNVDGPDHFKRFLSLAADPDLIVKAVTDEDVGFGLGVLGGQKVSDLSCVLGEGLHLGTIGSVVESQVALSVADEHSLFEIVEVKG